MKFKSNDADTRKGFSFNYRLLSPAQRQCEFNNGGCSSKCSIKNDYVLCSCYDGFELDLDGKTCNFIATSTSQATTVSTQAVTTSTTTTVESIACTDVLIRFGFRMIRSISKFSFFKLWC